MGICPLGVICGGILASPKRMYSYFNGNYWSNQTLYTELLDNQALSQVQFFVKTAISDL